MPNDDAKNFARQMKDFMGMAYIMQEEPLTKLADLENYLGDIQKNHARWSRGEITEKEYHQEKEAIADRYEGKVFENHDKYSFKTFQEFRIATGVIIIDYKERAETLKHEKEHFDAIKAAAPNADLEFTIWKAKNGKYVSYAPMVNLDLEGLGPEDYHKLLEAGLAGVSEPSEFDEKAQDF